jgi:RHS repeat-associated protein
MTDGSSPVVSGTTPTDAHDRALARGARAAAPTGRGGLVVWSSRSAAMTAGLAMQARSANRRSGWCVRTAVNLFVRRLGVGLVVAGLMAGSVGGTSMVRANHQVSLASEVAAPAPPPPGGVVPSAGGFGFTEGSFSVTDDGAAVYRLPLWLPPGRGDVHPELGLSFHSRAGNGLLGVGWSLDGLSSISPCARTFAQDGRSDGVRFGAADALCLDGERLVPLSSGRAPTREYRSEEDGFSRVVADGMIDGVADSFRVATKDGSILTFGGEARLQVPRLEPSADDDRPLVPGPTVTAAWLLSRIEDRNGNSASIGYQVTVGDQASLWAGQALPTVIEYAPNRRVELAYEPRPDLVDSFVGGVHTRVSTRLSAIRMYGGPQGGAAALLREYRLGYQLSSTTGRSLLTRAVECDSAGACKQPQTFQYSQGSYEFDVIDTGVTFAGRHVEENLRLIAGDINGDGRDDVLYPDATNDWKMRFSTGDGFGSERDAGIGRISPTEPAEIRPVDFNRDGRMDVMAQVQIATPPGQPIDRIDWRLYQSNGSEFRQYAVDIDEDRADDDPDPVYFGDIDGNGMPDYLSATYAGDPASQGRWYYRLNTGSGFAPTVVTNDREQPNFPGRLELGDLDGDGRSWLTVGDYADLNGDGLADWVKPAYPSPNPGGPTECCLHGRLNSGTGLARAAPSPAGYRPPIFTGANNNEIPASVRYVDMDNDGADDVLVFHSTYPQDPAAEGAEVWLWRNSAFVKAPLAVKTGFRTPNGFVNAQPLDIDGNGVLDLVYFNDDDLTTRDGHLRILKRSSGIPDLLIAAGIAQGPRVQVDYTTLADRAVHTPGTCTFPQTCPVGGGLVVAQHRIANPEAGGWSRFDHDYVAARVDVQGRGWLGFAQHRVTDQVTGAVTVTEFDNVTRDVTGPSAVYPYAARPFRITTTLPGPSGPSFRRTITNGWHLRRGLAGTYTAELNEVTDREEERSAATNAWRELRRRTTVRAYDEFGDATRVEVAVAGGRRTITTATFLNDQVAWLIGRPTRQVTVGCTAAKTCTTRTTAFGYDSKGNLTSTVVEPDDATLRLRTAVTYGAAGTIRAVTTSDATGQTRTDRFAYDADLLQPTAITNALGHVTRLGYDSGLGVMVERTDPNGMLTTMRYDRFGRPRATDRADGSFEHVSHLTLFGSQITTTDYSGGGRTSTILDPLGRETRRTHTGFDGRDVLTDTSYDSFGRVRTVSLPHRSDETPQLSTYEYDNRNRLIRRSDPDGAVVRHAYVGRETHTYDARGTHSYVVETADGDVAVSYQDDPGSTGWLATRFGYGPFGELTRVLAADGTTQTLGYDRLGRRTRHDDPSAGVTSSTYNAFGEVVTETNGAGETSRFRYDALGRTTRIDTPTGSVLTTWDGATNGIGMIAATTSADGVVTRHTYDNLGHNATTAWTLDGTRYEVRRSFDAVGRLSTLTYPTIPGSGQRLAVDYTYNAHGYVTQVADAATGGIRYWHAEARNSFGQLQRERFGNGVVTARTYVPSSGLLTRSVTTGPGRLGVLDDLLIGYDRNHNVEHRHETLSNRIEDYGYDVLNRLTSWRLRHPLAANTTTTYGYDTVGNLTTEVVAGQPERDATYQYGQAGAPAHALTALNTQRFTYDGAGRQIHGPRRSVEYNHLGLPAVVTWGNDGRTELAYDGDGQRVIKHDGDQTVHYVPGLFERRTPAGNDGLETHNIHDIVVNGRTVAQVNRIQSASGGPVVATKVSYLHTDQQGSLTLITGAGGLPLDEDAWPHPLHYDPFGQRVDTAGRPLGRNRDGGPRQGYTGHEHDDEIGVINMIGRIYDPAQRRFLTPDPHVTQPLNGQNHNRYSYVWNNPATLVDPTGFDPDDEGAPRVEDEPGYGEISIGASLTPGGFRGHTSILLFGAFDSPSTATQDDTELTALLNEAAPYQLFGSPDGINWQTPEVILIQVPPNLLAELGRLALFLVLVDDAGRRAEAETTVDREYASAIKRASSKDLAKYVRKADGPYGSRDTYLNDALRDRMARELCKRETLCIGPLGMMDQSTYETKQVQARFAAELNLYTNTLSGKGSGNPASGLIHAITGNVNAANIAGGYFDRLGAIAGYAGRTRTLDAAHDTAYGPLQPDPLR